MELIAITNSFKLIIIIMFNLFRW